MPPQTGTLTLHDLLEVRFQTAANFGLERIEEIVRRDLEEHNRIVEDILGDLVSVTTDVQRAMGTSIDSDMLEADEFSRVPTQRVIPGQTLGFPLRKFQYAVGWTRAFMKKRTPRDIAVQVQAAEKAHVRRIRHEIQRAIFRPTNYSFFDRHATELTLAVKALINADSSSIPNGPFGTTFDGATHTHYDASATLTKAAVDALVADVTEHGHAGNVRIAINIANEAAFRALAGFSGYVDPRLVGGDTTEPTTRLNINTTNNRPIGLISGAELWIKPWAIPNYAFAYDVQTEEKPLVFRNDNDEDGTGLRVEAQLETFPMYAQYLEALFGVGVWNRLNGAVLQFNNGTYTEPTLTY